MRVAGITVPDTALAREAARIASEAEPVEIYNHSLRSYLFAELIAKAKKIDCDSEALYVAAVMHDLGLSPAHESATERFEVDGANAARALLERHSIAAPRADLVWDAIALHDNGGIARWKQTEVMLLNAGVGADFGSHLDLMSRDAIAEILTAAPRTNFIPVFLAAVATVAEHKPFATGSCFMTEVAFRMVPSFKPVNFCDAVAIDPFDDFVKRDA